MKARKHAELIKQWADDDSLEIEVRIQDSDDWAVICGPSWGGACEYRIKPTKPSIDWSHIADEYKWLAVDECGHVYVYDTEPFVFDDYWKIKDGLAERCTILKSFKAGTCDWKDSLVKRPESEQ